MLAAGVDKLALFDPGEDSPEGWEEIVVAIYLAMESARESSLANPCK